MTDFAQRYVIGDFGKLNNPDSLDKAFFSWGTFVIDSENPFDFLELHENFCIVDNLDADGRFFILKDLRVDRPVLIQKDIGSNTFGVCCKEDFVLLTESIYLLLRNFSAVYLVGSTVPFQLIKITPPQSPAVVFPPYFHSNDSQLEQ